MGANEFELIARYFAPLAGPEGLGLADDAALMEAPQGKDLVVTTDLIAEGVHFFADDPPGAAAAKALRVNLSDLAAKGAVPHAYTLALAIGEAITEDWIAGFAAGLANDQRQYNVRLLGGDTSRGATTTIAITAIGQVPAGEMVRRSGASPGDAVLITGTIGDAALGLQTRRGALAMADEAAAAFLIDRYRFPQPRLAIATVVRAFASSAMDVSDGLLGDLEKLAAASGFGARIGLEEVPISPAARQAIDRDSTLLETAVTGGDDYEILMTIKPDRVADAIAEAAARSVPLAAIGEIVQRDGPPVVVSKAGQFVNWRGGFDHFGGGDHGQ